MIIDTHCHLNFRDYAEILSTVITNAKKAGVKKFIVPGVDYFSSVKSIDLAIKYKNVLYAAVGYHPYETDHNPDMNLIENLIKSYSSLITRPSSPIVALGECGLDYRLFKGENAVGKKQRQTDLFEKHLWLSVKYKLPFICHCRDAFDDLFNVMDSVPQLPPGVMHCFSGGLQDVRDGIRRNLYFGIDGNITYSGHLQAIVPNIPLDRLLLETDSPNLTPVPHRGTPNEPKYLNLIAKKIAVLKNISVTEVNTQTTINAGKLFNIC